MVPAIAVAAPPAVSVNPYVLDSMGYAPNTASQYLQYNNHGRPQKTVYGYGGQQKFASIPPAPPLEKPKSQILQPIVKPAGAANMAQTRKFKSIPKGADTHMMASGLTVLPMTAQKSQLPGLSMNGLAYNAFGHGSAMPNVGMGYRWSDIDPSQHGANLTVMSPGSMGPQVMEQVTFDKGDTQLDSKSMARVKAAGGKLKQDTRVSAELQGYSSDTNAGDARRTALTRVLEVRNTLIGMGVQGARLGVKPMGIPTDSGPADRVDIVVGK